MLVFRHNLYVHTLTTLSKVSLSIMTANVTGYTVYQGMATALDTLCAESFGLKSHFNATISVALDYTDWIILVQGRQNSRDYGSALRNHRSLRHLYENLALGYSGLRSVRSRQEVSSITRDLPCCDLYSGICSSC